MTTCEQRFITILLLNVVSGPGVALASWPAADQSVVTIAPGQLLTVSGLPSIQRTCLAPNPGAVQGPGPDAPAQLTGFQGPDSINIGDKNGTGPFPVPDPDIAAGPNNIVAVTNGLVSIYDKSGSCLDQITLINSFANALTSCSYTTPGCTPPFDPRITYDPLEGRWLLVAVYKDTSGATPVARILLAVSQTPDPTASWFNFVFDGTLDFGGAMWADQEDIGFDNTPAASGGAVYVTANQPFFDPTIPRNMTASLFIIAKSALYAGSGSACFRAWNFLNPDGTKALSLRPATMFAPTTSSPVEYLANTELLTQASSPSVLTSWKVVPTFPYTANGTLNITPFVMTGSALGIYPGAPAAGQPPACNGAQINTTNVTIVNGSPKASTRLYNLVWRNSFLYGALTQRHTFTDGDFAAIHYFALNTFNGGTLDVNRVFSTDGANDFLSHDQCRFTRRHHHRPRPRRTK